MMDRVSGRPRGFGFVTMSTPEEAQKAIEALNGKTIDGRALTVNVAKPREERSGGGGGGGRRSLRRRWWWWRWRRSWPLLIFTAFSFVGPRFARGLDFPIV